MRRYFNPYKIILRNKIVEGFKAFSKGDYKPLLDLYDEEVHQVFEGDHALGGQRRSKKKVEEWFERFVRLLPSQFDIQDVVIQGWPWDTAAVVVFQDRVSPKGIAPYVNQGIMNTRVQWGRATEVHIYVNTALISGKLKELEESGVEEAGYLPIE